jgi:hypothetical protein
MESEAKEYPIYSKTYLMLAVVACPYNPSYSGGRDRRTMIQRQPRQKHETLSKTKCNKKGWGCGSSCRVLQAERVVEMHNADGHSAGGMCLIHCTVGLKMAKTAHLMLCVFYCN